MKYPYLTVALLVFFGIIDIAIVGDHYELTKSDWSGWVQAIGSIAALGVAIYVMSRQNRHAAKLMVDADKRALVRRAHAVSGIIDRAHSQFEKFRTALSQEVANGNAAQMRGLLATVQCMLLDVLNAARAIPTHELGSYDMVSGVHEMIDGLASFERITGVWLARTTLPNREEIEKAMLTTKNTSDAAKTLFHQGFDNLKNQ